MLHRVRFYAGFGAGLMLVALWTMVACSRTDDSFTVGTARREITPGEPLPLWGHVHYRDTLSKGTLDPLYANAVVMQIGGKRVAVVTLDLGRTPAESSLSRIRKQIKSRAGVDTSFITATHTHHGPVMELSAENGKGKGRFDSALRYYKQLEDTIISAVVEAADNRKPAQMRVGGIQLTNFNYNRHTLLQPSARDTDLAIMRLDDLSGKPIAILVNFAAHPTLVPDSVLKFSADYVGVLNDEVRKQTGANVLFVQGAAGDMGPDEPPDYQAFGKALAREVVQLASSIKDQPVLNPVMEIREEQFRFDSRIRLKDSSVRRQLDETFFPELVANYVNDYEDGIRPRLTVALLDRRIALVGVSGEFFCNHAIRLKERARLQQLFFCGYANGYNHYFPTIEAAAEEGYGGNPLEAPAAIGAGEQMMNTALIWIYEMQRSRESTAF